MKGGIRPLGYTIVEVMIFLAVSGVMFLLAASFISGKQEVVEFKQGLTSTATQVQNTLNAVSNGEFPSLASISCSAIPYGQPTISATPAPQGTNGGPNGCIFLGKVIQFNVGNVDTNYEVYTIAARQTDTSTGQDVASFSAAQPIDVDQYKQASSLEYGLEYTKSFICTSSMSCLTPLNGAFGVYTSFDAGATTGQSGAQSIIVAPVPNAISGETPAVMRSTMDSPVGLKASTQLSAGSFILLCFQEGSRIGSVSIGGSEGQQFTTSLQSGGPFACN
jgi:hypothetical protein